MLHLPSPISRQEALECGLTYYFNGKRCKHGHIAERQVSNYTCVICARALSRRSGAEWKINNREVYLEDQRQRAFSRHRRDLEKSRAYKAEQQRQYRARYPERAAASIKRSKAKKPGLYSAIYMAHKAAELFPTWVDRELIKAFYLACPPGMVVDHIVPRKGRTVEGYRVTGLHVPWNLQYLTDAENKRKLNRMRPEDQPLGRSHACSHGRK